MGADGYQDRPVSRKGRQRGKNRRFVWGRTHRPFPPGAPVVHQIVACRRRRRRRGAHEVRLGCWVLLGPVSRCCRVGVHESLRTERGRILLDKRLSQQSLDVQEKVGSVGGNKLLPRAQRQTARSAHVIHKSLRLVRDPPPGRDPAPRWWGTFDALTERPRAASHRARSTIPRRAAAPRGHAPDGRAAAALGGAALAEHRGQVGHRAGARAAGSATPRGFRNLAS